MPEHKISQVYSLSEQLPDPDIRSALISALRPRLRETRPPRPMTPVRLFCMPFEVLLRNDNPRVRRLGLIPRAVILPLWNLIVEAAEDPARLAGTSDGGTRLPRVFDVEHCGDPLLAEALKALAAVRRQAVRDPAFAAGPAVRNFWDAAAEIEIVLAIRTDLAKARRILQEAARVGRLTSRDVGEVGTLARKAAGSARDRMRLFLTVLALHKPIAAVTLDLIDSLAQVTDMPVADDIFSLSYADALDTLRRGMSADPDPSGPLAPLAKGMLAGADILLSMSAAVRSTRGPDIRRLEGEIRSVVMDRLLPAVDRRLNAGLDEMGAILVAGGRLSECALAADLETLAESRRVFQAVGLDAVQRDRMAGLLSAVEERLCRIARTGSTGARTAVLRAAVEAALLVEPVCGNDGMLAMMRSIFAAAVGRPPPEQNDKFLIDLIRELNPTSISP